MINEHYAALGFAAFLLIIISSAAVYVGAL
jgi:hypothetical protein